LTNIDFVAYPVQHSLSYVNCSTLILVNVKLQVRKYIFGGILLLSTSAEKNSNIMTGIKCRSANHTRVK